MALELSFTLETGITCQAAYAKIAKVSFSHTELTADLEVFASAQARFDLKPPVKLLSFSLPWISSVSLEYVYNQIKSTAEFANAIDI